MKHLHPGVAQACVLALSATLLVHVPALQAREQGGNNKKVSLSLKATPAISFAPARVVLVAELKGGEDSEELYCPSVEWEWGDLTTSVNEADCDPYVAGKSEVKRRYTVEHQFKNPGSFKVSLRLKKGQKIVASANTQVSIRASLGQEP